MKLTRIVLVNWYLFNPIDIDLRGNTALIGENGAGKSTVIDAIQVVLFGGNNRYIKFNAQSSDSGNDRSIKTYCLGVFRPESEGGTAGANRLRSECVSYLALCFEDENGKVANLMVGIEARHDEARADVRLMAVSEGDKPLSYKNFVDINPDGTYNINPIATTKSRLNIEGFDFSSFDKKSDYFSAVSKLIGPKDHIDWIDPTVLSGTLSRSLSLSEITGVSNFVENFILEEKKINIDTLINSRNRYRELQVEVAKDKAKLEVLNPIKSKFNSSLTSMTNEVSYQWIHAEKTIEKLELDIESKREQRYNYYLDARKDNRTKIASKQKRQILSDELKELRDEVASNDIAKQERDINNKIKLFDKEVVTLEATLARLYIKLDAISKLQLDVDVNIDVSSIERLRIAIEQGEPNFKAIDECITVLIVSLAKELKDYSLTTFSDVSNKSMNIDAELTNLYKLIKDAKDGKPSLSPKTNLVVKALKEHGINVAAICELAIISNKDWQPAIEAVLGTSGCEALIVEPKDEVRAIAIYRKLKGLVGSSIYGVNIVKTSKWRSWLNTFDKNSAAQLIQSDNEYALAYLHHRLGGFLLVKTEEELKTNRAITQDGMISTSSIVSKNKLPTTFKLIKDQADNIEVWQAEFDKKGAEKLIFDAAKARHNNNQEILSDFISLYAEDTPSTVNIDERLGDIKNEKEILEKNLEKLDLTSVHQKEVRIETIGTEINTLDSSIEKSAKDYGISAAVAKGLQKEELLIFENELPAITLKRTELESSPLYDQHVIAGLEDKTTDEFGEDLTIYLNKATVAQNRAETSFNDGRERLKAYLTDDNFILDRAVIAKDKLTSLIDIIAKQFAYIEEHGLARHDEEAKRACQDVNEAFRTDMINRLRESFSFMKAQFNTLNKVLKNKEFHHETYQFTYKKKTEYKDLIDYIINTSDLDTVAANDLFDDTPENVIDQIDQLVDGAANNSTVIEDYRQYFTYDVRVIRKISEEKSEEVMLSRLLKTGSGGEKKSPFYVAIASSLASAWKTLKRPDESAGIILLDEAFDKLSERNLSNAIHFMNEVGLQLIIAAPLEREPVFRPAMDTVIYFTKEGRAVEVESDILTDVGRALLTDSNPSLRKSA